MCGVMRSVMCAVMRSVMGGVMRSVVCGVMRSVIIRDDTYCRHNHHTGPSVNILLPYLSVHTTKCDQWNVRMCVTV
jgi:uncharacterized membrane protein YeiH